MITASYDAIAEWYDVWVGHDSILSGTDPFFPSVKPLMGSVGGLRICDVACGQGRAARYLAAQGAQVVGVDLSEKMLAIARRFEDVTPRGIEYHQDDAHQLGSLEDASFDGVLCFQALMDIPDLPATLRSVQRILRPGGWFIFSTLHPCYNPPPSSEIPFGGTTSRVVSGYFDEGYWRSDARPGPPGKVGAYHRTLSTYVNALADAGLTVERMNEPQLSGRHAEHRPVWAEVPAVLVVRCRKDA
jgi:ubiquinone/menaquinone biosynthesis C-methylase UbiE